MLKMDIFSICWARSGSNRSSRSLVGVDEEASGSLELARLWQNRLNYSGSSAQTIAIQAV
jgi:hypothetical protein